MLCIYRRHLSGPLFPRLYLYGNGPNWFNNSGWNMIMDASDPFVYSTLGCNVTADNGTLLRLPNFCCFFGVTCCTSDEDCPSTCPQSWKNCGCEVGLITNLTLNYNNGALNCAIGACNMQHSAIYRHASCTSIECYHQAPMRRNAVPKHIGRHLFVNLIVDLQHCRISSTLRSVFEARLQCQMLLTFLLTHPISNPFPF